MARALGSLPGYETGAFAVVFGVGVLGFFLPLQVGVAIGVLMAGLLLFVFLGSYKGTLPTRSLAMPLTLKLPSVVKLFWAALALRVACNFLVNGFGFNWALAPDSEHFLSSGSMLADVWSKGINLSSWRAAEGRAEMNFYRILNGVFVWSFGEGASRYLVPLLNSVIGLAAVAVVAQMVREIWGEDEARVFFLVVAFLPSLVLWTSINLREAWAYLFLATIVYSIHRLRRGVQMSFLALLLLSLYGASHVRAYLVPMVIAGTLPAVFVTRVRYLPLTILASVALGGLGLQIAETREYTVNFSLASYLEEAARLRSAMDGGGSGYGDIRQSSLGFLPKGLAYFFFAPFPWNMTSALKLISLPEVLVWYVLFLVSFRGILRSLRERLRDVTLPLSMCLAIALPYSLVEANEGTAYRHRAQMLIFFLIFASVEIARYLRALRPAKRFASRAGVGLTATATPVTTAKVPDLCKDLRLGT